MNVYFKNTNNVKIFGILEALKNTEHNIIMFENNVSIFNLFETDSPDMIFLTEDDLNLLNYIIHDYPNIKIILFKHTKDLYLDIKYQEIDLVNQDSDNFLDYLYNDIIYHNGKFDEKYKCDFLILTDNINEQSYITDICNGIGSAFNIKIYGLNKINSVYYLGIPELNEYKNIITSCNGIIMFNNEWFYTALYNNKIPLIYHDNPLHHFQFNKYDQLFQMCDYIIKSKEINNNLNYSNKTYSHYIKEKLGIV